MTRYQVPREETSINLSHISEHVFCKTSGGGGGGGGGLVLKRNSLIVIWNDT